MVEVKEFRQDDEVNQAATSEEHIGKKESDTR